MNAKRLAIVAVAVILAAAIAVLMLMPAPDDRTRTEKMALTASDLAGMNATQRLGPFPSPYHPNLSYGGSEASESDLWLTVDGWDLNVQCLLVLYNSSSSASQTFDAIGFDADWTEIDAGDRCFMGDYHNETYGGERVMRVNIYAIVLQNDTVTYFTFAASPPWDDFPDSPVPMLSPQVIETMKAIIDAQVEKVRQSA